MKKWRLPEGMYRPNKYWGFGFLILIAGAIIIKAFIGFAASSGNYVNTGASAVRVPANATSVLVLDVTIPDAWNGGAFSADIEKKAGTDAYWQGDALNSFTALGNLSGVGYKEDGTAGFQGTEPVVIDIDGDKSYTVAKDTLLDADGTATTDIGADTTTVGTLLLPMTSGIAANAHSVCTNSTSSPTAIRIDSGGGCTNSGGVGSAGTYLIGTGVSSIEADTTWGFNDKNSDGIFDDGEPLYKINIAPRLTSTSTLVDADGSVTTGAGTTTSTVGTLLTAFFHKAATGSKNVCVDSLAAITTMRINTSGNCNGTGGTYILGTSATASSIELTGRYSFIDSNSNGTYDAGEDIFKQSIAGTYSGNGDTNVYNTAGLSSGDALVDFASDCDGGESGTKVCRYTGTGTITSGSSILVDEGTKGGAAPNGVVDKQADSLIGLGIQNAGTAADSTDIAAVRLWVENGSSTGFQASQDALLGTFTVDSLNSNRWQIGKLSQSVPAAGKRIYVTVDVAANPTNSSTLQFQIPTYSDVSTNNAPDTGDFGVFMSSNNDGPTDEAILNSEVQVIDTLPPTITLTALEATTTNASPLHITATFSEPVTGFALGDISVTNGSASNLASSSASVYTFDVTPSGQGTVSVNVGAGAAADSAGNLSNAASQLSRTYDSIKPTIALSSEAPTSTNSSPLHITATFSEAVTGFTSDDVTVGNGSVSNFVSVSATVYTFDVAPSGQGSVTVDVGGGGAQDAAGNTNSAASQLSRIYDTVRPGITLSSGVGGTSDVSPIVITATFTEDVTGFDATDVSVTNGTAGNIISINSSTYTFEVSPLTNGAVSVSIGSGGAQDAAGNTNTASGNTIAWTFDSPKPTVVLSSATVSPTNSSPITITATFSKAVHGFTSGDITLTSAALVPGSLASSSDTVYTFSITPSGQGPFTISIEADTVTDDTDTYTNFASNNFSLTYDSISPTVTLASTASSSTNISPIHITAVFSESVTGFESTDVSVSNGTVSNFESNTASSYSFDVTPTSQATVTVDIADGVAQDAAGNTNSAATQLARNYHTAPPVFSVQYYSDPSLSTSLGNNPVFKTGTYYLKITSDEALSDSPLITIDAEGTNNDVANATTSLVSGNIYSYTRTIASDFFAVGAVKENIGITGQDEAGNIAADADPTEEDLSAAYTDTTRPTVTLTSSASSTTKYSPIPVTATFSENVTGFATSGISIINGTASSISASSSAVYTFTVTPSGQGDVSVTIKGGAAEDPAGNGNTTSSALTRTFDSVAPVLTGGDPIGTTTSTTPSYTFNSDSSGTITYAGGCTSATTNADSGDITITFDTLAAGDYECTITLTDPAGNSTTLSIPKFTVAPPDVTPPSFTIQYFSDAAFTSSMGDNPKLKAGTYYIKITADESLSSPPTITIAAEGANNDVTDAATTLVSGNVYSYTRTIAADALAVGSVVENISITGTDLAANIATNTDPVNEPSKAAYTDTVVPTVTLTSSASSTTKYSPIPVTATFSEPVTGFATSGITIINGTAGSITASSSSVYTFNVTPSGQGTVTITIEAGAVGDSAGNDNTTSSALTRTFDSVAPVLTGGDPIGNTADTTPSYTFNSNSSGTITYAGGCTSATTNISSGDVTITFDTLALGDHDCTITITDEAGNSTILTIPQFTIIPPDTTPPVISDISVTPSTSTATISWKTDEFSSSQASYGLTSISTLTTSETDTSPRKKVHTVNVSDLVSCATYHFSVFSKDADGNQASSTDDTFTTKGCAGDAAVLSKQIGTVNKDTGGTLSLLSSGKGIALDIPSGFAGQNAEFQIKKLDATASLGALGAPSKYRGVGDYVYALHSLSDTQTAIDTFNASLTITMTYGLSDATGLDESSFKIYRNDGAGWIALSGCVVDTFAKSVTCDTGGFSTFALFGQAPGTPAPSSPGGWSSSEAGAFYAPVRIAQIQSLPVKAQDNAITTVQTTATSSPYQFKRRLRLTSTGDDVKRLQVFLNSRGYALATSGPGSAGNETTYFGQLLKAALIRFQESFAKDILLPQNITQGTGNFFQFTMRLVNLMLREGR